MRESTVEQYLRDQVAAAGGMVEKHTAPGRIGVPDDLVTWPPRVGKEWGEMDLVETKAPGKKPRGTQNRDHVRRASRRVPVYLLDTKEKVDDYIWWRLKGCRAPHLHSVQIPE